jgi:prepilin-type N-terminal cleavage/methylation domain-containing protein
MMALLPAPLMIKRLGQGFTLSELMVSLGVLGLIAAIAIPTAWSSIDDNTNKTLFRESVRILNEATAEIANNPPTLTAPNNTTWDLYDQYLNSADDNRVAMSFMLPSGVVLSSFDYLANDLNLEGIQIDINGNSPPNVLGKDQLHITACYNPIGNCPAQLWTVNQVEQESGTIGPIDDNAAGTFYNGNEAFYAKIMAI